MGIQRKNICSSKEKSYYSIKAIKTGTLRVSKCADVTVMVWDVVWHWAWFTKKEEHCRKEELPFWCLLIILRSVIVQSNVHILVCCLFSDVRRQPIFSPLLHVQPFLSFLSSLFALIYLSSFFLYIIVCLCCPWFVLCFSGHNYNLCFTSFSTLVLACIVVTVHTNVQ